MGFATAVGFGIIENKFTEEVLTISTVKICQMEILKNVLNKKCDKDTKTETTINQNFLSITKDPKTKTVRIRNE